ncbi:UNVERIFIED_CONTAM: hypothetical protein Sradi_5739900 [Sesamum radiatum]|uniref:Uncharacterized protein n=1 Tax=Sesamum radiatum TaxID=300843 RepID=A0AAW2L6E9_SESRA
MAGVRQFKGNSSAMTVSVKGTPCRSSSSAPSIWYFTSCRPFCRCVQHEWITKIKLGLFELM